MYFFSINNFINQYYLNNILILLLINSMSEGLKKLSLNLPIFEIRAPRKNEPIRINPMSKVQ